MSDAEADACECRHSRAAHDYMGCTVPDCDCAAFVPPAADDVASLRRQLAALEAMNTRQVAQIDALTLAAVDLEWLRCLAGNHTVDLNRLPKWAASLRDRALAAGVEAMKSSAAPEARSGDTEDEAGPIDGSAWPWTAEHAEELAAFYGAIAASKRRRAPVSASLPPSAPARITPIHTETT